MSRGRRLDQILAERGLCASRERAHRLIRAGRVRVNGTVATKPGHTFAEDAGVEISENAPFVSRGGEKLMAALDRFKIRVEGRICLDIGASTGGFTDCLLKNGAAAVTAVDVGAGQLHWDLRRDQRVEVREKTNARYLEPGNFNPLPQVAVIDVSFISLTLVLPPVRDVLAVEGDLVTLIKPQFEAGRKNVGKGGVVSDPKIHAQVIQGIRKFGTGSLSMQWCGILRSPLTGPAGNIEFLTWWKKI
jgi:23S rRNA (cytidine1920-2'-O)/16S rRNA (cytidine1409-2'-O)-methyltransferase